MVTPWQAHTGGQVDFDTPQGVVTLTIPPNTRSGKRLRLRGQGLANGKEGATDLVARIEIDLPETLTPRQRALLAVLGRVASHKCCAVAVLRIRPSIRVPSSSRRPLEWATREACASSYLQCQKGS